MSKPRALDKRSWRWARGWCRRCWRGWVVLFGLVWTEQELGVLFFGRRKVLALFFRPIGATVDLEDPWKINLISLPDASIQPWMNLFKKRIAPPSGPPPSGPTPEWSRGQRCLPRARPSPSSVPCGKMWPWLTSLRTLASMPTTSAASICSNFPTPRLSARKQRSGWTPEPRCSRFWRMREYS